MHLRKSTVYIISLIFVFSSTIRSAESFTSGPTNTPDPFSLGVGAGADTRINLNTTKATDLRIGFYDPPGYTELVRRFYSDLMPSTTLSTLWLGTDDNGLELPAGTYRGKFLLKLQLTHQVTIQGSGIIFDDPSDIAVDSTGNIYVINKGNRTVQKFNPGGVLLLFDFQSVSASNQPQGIAVDGSGNIYVANTFLGTVEKYNSSGVLVSSNWATGLNQPTGMSSDSTYIYIADQGDDVIYRVAITTGGAVSTICSPGGGNNSFSDPQDVDVDSLGNFYIVGINPQGKFTLFKHTSAGAYNAKVQVEPSVAAPGWLSGISVDSLDNIYITWTGDEGPPLKEAYIAKYNSGLVQQTTYGTFGSATNQFKVPLGCGAFYDVSTTNTYIYVSDSWNSRIQKIGDDGTVLGYVDTISEDQDNVLSPNDIAVDSSGNLYVALEQANIIKVFNASGIYQNKISSYGTTAGFLSRPYGVAVDSSGRVFVSDLGWREINGRVQIFTNGVYSGDHIPAQANKYPRGLGIDTNDIVYTAWSDGEVWKDGALWATPGTSADDICIDYKRDIYIASSADGTVYRYSSNATSLGSVGSDGTPGVGICVDEFGDIFMSSSAGIERYNNDLSTRLGTYLSTVLDNASGIAFTHDYQYIWIADHNNNFIKKYSLSWDAAALDPNDLTISDTNAAPTVNGLALSGSVVNESGGTYYSRNGKITFTVTFSENMNTSSNLDIKFTVNAVDTEIGVTSFIGNTWIGTASVASNNDGTATITVRDGYDAGGTQLDPHPNINFSFVIDTIPPAPPTVDQPGSPTSEKTITVTGSAEQNVYVHVYNHSGITGGTNFSYQSNVVVDGDGNWAGNAISLFTPTPPNTNWIWAIAVDKAGNISIPSSPRKKVVYVDPTAGSGYIAPTDDVYLGTTTGAPWSIFYIVNSYMSNGTMTIELPSGWAAPDTNSSAPGYVYIKSYSSMTLETILPLAVTNHTIKISFENAVPGAQVEIIYGNTNLTVVSNYAKIGINSFNMQAENNDPDHDWFPGDTVVPQSADESLNITVLGSPLKVDFANSMPTNVARGDSFITVMTLFFQNNNGGTNHDEVRTLKLISEDSNLNPINADSAIAQIRIRDKTNVFKTMSAPASSLINLDLSLSPITVYAGTTKTILIDISISLTASAKSILLNLNSDTDIVARDKSSQTAINVTTNTASFPMRTSFAVIETNLAASEITFYFLDILPSYFEAGQTNAYTARLVFRSTNSNVNEVKVTELYFNISDSSLNGIIPSNLLNSVTIQPKGGGSPYKIDTALESSGSQFFIDMWSNPVFIPNNTSVTVELKLGIKPSASVTNFMITLSDTNSIQARDKIENSYVSVRPAPETNFPMRTGTAGIAYEFEIHHDGYAFTSIADRVIIRVINYNKNLFTDYAGTISLDTDGSAGIDWATNYSHNGSFGNSAGDRAYYIFSSADNGVITLAITDPTSETITLSAYSSFLSTQSNNFRVTPSPPATPLLQLTKTAFNTNNGTYTTLGGATNDLVPGTLIRYIIHYTNVGTGDALAPVLQDTIPSDTVYRSNTLDWNGTALSDASDGDQGDYGNTQANTITVNITNIPAGAGGTIKFEVIVQ